MSVFAIIALTSSLATPGGALTPEHLSLGGQWNLVQPQKHISISANVPGLVQTDLIHAGLMADPYYRDNGKNIAWASQMPWNYSRHFTVSPEFLQHRKIVLRCEGLDTLATVSVNHQVVAHTDNMFRTWEFDAKRFLKSGVNSIEVTFDPVDPYVKAHEVQTAFPGKSMPGWGYLRKPPFQQGWDFAPVMITSGIWKNIGLVAWDAARITDVSIVQSHYKTGKVGLHVDVLADTAQAATHAHATVLFHGQKVTEGDVRLEDGKAEVRLTVDKPQLWWPAGMGKQNLYQVQVQLLNTQKKVVDQSLRRIGLRTIDWQPKTPDSPLTLMVNGQRIFAKGSNWVPRDAMPTRATAERENSLVAKAVHAHMNLMRLWGGGFYENDSFFDACDEKGLMVWFEFKYADATYPAFDAKWLAGVTAEAEDNVRRVQHHPSIAIYSGNNECIGFIGDKTVGGRISQADYNLLFHETLKDVVKRIDPMATYTPGSPEIGDDHDWDVWHGSALFNSYRNVHGFLSEYGFQAFPVPMSIDQFTKPEDRTSIGTPVMKFHQRNWRDGNQLIVSTAKKQYRTPKDFESTLWLSQIQQAEGVLTGVEHWRRDWPHSSGSLVWQFDDCWPSISWAMVDYYGRPKALYYRLQHAYAPVALSGLSNATTGQAELWVVNDRSVDKKGRISWTLIKLDGTPLKRGYTTVSIPAGTSSTKAITLDEKDAVDSEGASKLLLWATLHVVGEPDSTTVLSFVTPKNLALVEPEIKTSVKPADGGYLVTLSAKHPALWAWVELKGIDADLSDNFVSLCPGQPESILVRPKAKTSLATVKKALLVKSLFNTYLPGEEPIPTVVAATDGSLTATAELAEIVGDTAGLEAGVPGNIGNWTNPKDSLAWILKGVKPGAYAVTAVVSIPANEAGSTFAVEIDGSQVTGTVPGTQGWTDYKEISLGNVQITSSGTAKLWLRPTKKADAHVMNLRSIRLQPVR